MKSAYNIAWLFSKHSYKVDLSAFFVLNDPLINTECMLTIFVIYFSFVGFIFLNLIFFLFHFI
jgi:hypothetical protein